MSAIHGHDDDFLYMTSYVDIDSLPPLPVKLAMCGHWIGEQDDALTCWSCSQIKFVDAELRRIIAATEKDADREWLASLGTTSGCVPSGCRAQPQRSAKLK